MALELDVRRKQKGVTVNSALKLLLVLMTVGSVSGCANRATAMVDPASDLSRIKSVHVVKLERDGRGINVLIADKMRSRGLRVTGGPADKPEGVDAVVSYADKWTWDMTMYMVELTITLRDPKTEFPLATGNSMHGSLSRKSPKEMVDEVVDNIFSKASK